jgi:hypothetical protein
VRTHGERLLTRAGRTYILPHLKKAGSLADLDPLVTEMLQGEPEPTS